MRHSLRTLHHFSLLNYIWLTIWTQVQSSNAYLQCISLRHNSNRLLVYQLQELPVQAFLPLNLPSWFYPHPHIRVTFEAVEGGVVAKGLFLLVDYQQYFISLIIIFSTRSVSLLVKRVDLTICLISTMVKEMGYSKTQCHKNEGYTFTLPRKCKKV